MRVESLPAKALLLTGVVASVFTVPYLFPVPVSIGVSYVTQFNNRAAVLVFIAGTLLYATLTDGDLGRADERSRDRKLSAVWMFAALALFTLLYLAQILDTPIHGIPIEPSYSLDRLQMLFEGRRPYTDFEFAYGPLQLYVPYFVSKVFHTRPLTSYYFWVLLEWQTGIVMLWFTVRALPFVLRWRALVFWCFLLLQLPYMRSESVIYTALRGFLTVFCILSIHHGWQRWKRPYWTVMLSVIACGFAIGISPEQGVGIAAGLGLWFTLLAVQRPVRFPRNALAVLWILFAALFLLAHHYGVLRTMIAFSRGAFSYPICPSAHIAVILVTYIAAACMTYQFVSAKDYGSVTLPMLAGGFAMLPAAMGRSDLGHLQMAAPALVLGVAALQSHRTLRRWWTPAVLIGFLAPAAFAVQKYVPAMVAQASTARVWQQRHGLMQASDEKTVAWPFRCSTFAAGQQGRNDSDAPFRSPDVSAPLLFRRDLACLDTGYNDRWLNAFTPADIERKVSELRQSPRQPLVLFDTPLEVQFPVIDGGASGLRGVQWAIVYPPVRRKPFSSQQLIDYIREHYTPEDQAQGGYRVWRPKEQ